HKVISEHHRVKVLAAPDGVVLSWTTKTFSYLIFLSRPLVGLRKIRTQDRIVAKAGYDIRRTLQIIDDLYGKGGLWSVGSQVVDDTSPDRTASFWSPSPPTDASVSPRHFRFSEPVGDGPRSTARVDQRDRQRFSRGARRRNDGLRFVS